jgi:DNA processing protein
MSAGGEGRRGVPLSDRQRLNWLRLIRSDNVGPATFRDLINHFGSAETAIAQLPELSRRGGSARTIRVASVDEAERETGGRERKFGAVFIGIGEPDYPPALRRIDGAPPLIAAIGDLALATRTAVGIVGARNASVSGAKMAARMARDLGAAGMSSSPACPWYRCGRTPREPRSGHDRRAGGRT